MTPQRKKPPRRSPLKRTQIKSSRKRVPSRRKDPAKRRFASKRDPAYCAWIRTLPCLLWHLSAGRQCAGRVECAHVKARGAGGDDVANTVPLCTHHHRESHAKGRRDFEYKYSVNLADKASYYGAMQPPKCERDCPELYGGSGDR